MIIANLLMLVLTLIAMSSYMESHNSSRGNDGIVRDKMFVRVNNRELLTILLLDGCKLYIFYLSVLLLRKK